MTNPNEEKAFFPLEAVKELARLREDLDNAISAKIAAHEPMMKTPEWKAVAEADDQIVEIRSLLVNAEAAFKDGCENIFEETDEKEYPGGKIKTKSTLEYAEAEAVEWAIKHEHPELLSIIKKEFKKIEKALSPAFVTRGEVGKMYIDSDLSQYLE